jgi:hypothetical protein
MNLMWILVIWQNVEPSVIEVLCVLWLLKVHLVELIQRRHRICLFQGLRVVAIVLVDRARLHPVSSDVVKLAVGSFDIIVVPRVESQVGVRDVRSFIVTRPFNMFVVGHSLATDDDRCLVLNRILRKLALVRHVVMFF